MKAAAIWNALGDGLVAVAGLLAKETPEALAAAKGLVDTLLHAHAGTLQAADIATAIRSLQERLEANDAAALEQLAARFALGKDGSK